MSEKKSFNKIRDSLLNLMGIADLDTIRRLGHKVDDLEKYIKILIKKQEETLEITHEKPRRVILADTDTNSYDTVQAALPEGLELKMINNWDLLFRETKKANIPLLIIDLAMLGAEGVENIRKLREENPGLRIVALSSYLSASLAEAMPEGVDLSGILQKPLNAFQVKEDIARHLLH